jgi:hypothetical protein
VWSRVGSFYVAICGWCQRAVTVGAIGAILLGLVGVATAFSQQGPESPSQLWAQLLQTGVILVVAGAVVRMFFTFKDAAIKQAEIDRDTSQKSLAAVKEDIAELNHAILGIGGYGGLLEAVKLDASRRHELSNQIVRTHERIHTLAEQVERVARRVGEPFDKRLLEDI